MNVPIRTDRAPKPAAAYEQAIRSGDLIFVSGQVASDPATGQIIASDIEGQVTQALKNIESILQGAGSSRTDVVRCGVFLADLNDFAAMNRAYKEFFGDALPARTTVQVGLGSLRVEIDAIAVRSQSAKSGKNKKGAARRPKPQTRRRKAQ